MGDHSAFFGKSFHMLGLFFQEIDGNKERKIGVFHAGGLEHPVHLRHDVFPQGISPGFDDHAAAHRGALGHVRGFDDLLIPFRIIFSPRR
jgi:hypothetical protein